jgi:iron complex transport system ATP-binding protein
MNGLRAERLTLGYDAKELVVHDLDLDIEEARITALVGPNGCGKSTLLRGLARLLKPRGGAVYLDGQAISRVPTKEVAKRLGLLPQSATVPDGVTVEDLVDRGRYPHRQLFMHWTPGDEEAVERALTLTDMQELRDRPVDELSGGQRQRAWIAMALAQETPIMLLDEPTTFLDLAHQVEVLELLRQLNEGEERTVVLVLHDLNHAARYADRIVALKDGRVFRQGEPSAVIDEELLQEVFGLECLILTDPLTGAPYCIPRTRQRSTERISSIVASEAEQHVAGP